MKMTIICIAAIVLASCGDGTRTDRDSMDTLSSGKTDTKETPMGPLAKDDADFIRETIAKNYEEIKLAGLAVRKSTNAEVQQIARMLEQDHQTTMQQLQTLANNKSLALPPVDSMDVLKEVDDMGKKNAMKFDKEWCKEMSDAHEETIRKFEKASNNITDADLRVWITQTLPTLKQHYSQLEACRKKLS